MQITDLPPRWQDRLTLDPKSDCWLWSGAKTMGYGKASLSNRIDYTHRWAYRMLVGEIGDHQLHHVCQVKACCNPSHLMLVTRTEHQREHGLFGLAALRAEQSTCVNGHPFDQRDKRQRVCGICARERGREWARRTYSAKRDAKNARRREARRNRAEAGWD